MGNAQRCSPAAPAPRPAPAMEVLAGRPFSAPRPARRGAMAAAAAELGRTGTPRPAPTPPPPAHGPPPRATRPCPTARAQLRLAAHLPWLPETRVGAAAGLLRGGPARSGRARAGLPWSRRGGPGRPASAAPWASHPRAVRTIPPRRVCRGGPGIRGARPVASTFASHAPGRAGAVAAASRGRPAATSLTPPFSAPPPRRRCQCAGQLEVGRGSEPGSGGAARCSARAGRVLARRACPALLATEQGPRRRPALPPVSSSGREREGGGAAVAMAAP